MSITESPRNSHSSLRLHRRYNFVCSFSRAPTRRISEDQYYFVRRNSPRRRVQERARSRASLEAGRVGSERRQRNSIRNPCDAFLARVGRRRTIVGYRRQVPKKINGASTPSRRGEARALGRNGTEGKGEREGGREKKAATETKGARGRIDPIRAIHPRNEPRWCLLISIAADCLPCERGAFTSIEITLPPSSLGQPWARRTCRGSS